MLAFEVPGPPVPCARARVLRNGHAFTPPRTVAYERTVKLHALNAARRQGWPVPPLAGKFRVDIDVHRAGPRGDIDNFAKAILDGMSGIAYPDDVQVVELRVRLVPADKPCAVVTVRRV